MGSKNSVCDIAHLMFVYARLFIIELYKFISVVLPASGYLISLASRLKITNLIINLSGIKLNTEVIKTA